MKGKEKLPAIKMGYSGQWHRRDTTGIVKNTKAVRNRLKQAKVDEYSLANMNALRYEGTHSVTKLSTPSGDYYIYTDTAFLESLSTIAKGQYGMLYDIWYLHKKNALSYSECDQIHSNARLHSNANVFNVNTGKYRNNAYQDMLYLFCNCGCGRMSGKAFPLCMDINDKKMTVLGSGIILLFKLLKSLTVNLLLFTGIYAVFGLVTNLMGDYVVYADSNCTGSYCFFRDDASDYSKYHDYATSPIQAWLGLAAIVIWSINMRYMKYSGEYLNEVVKKDLKSSSDFAVKIDNLPFGEYNEEEVLEYLYQLWYKIEPQHFRSVIDQYPELKERYYTEFNHKKNHNVYQQGQYQSYQHYQYNKDAEDEHIKEFFESMNPSSYRPNHFLVKSIQIVYKMQFSRGMTEKIMEMCLSIQKMLKQGYKMALVKDVAKYKQAKKELIELYYLFQDLRKKFLTDGNFRAKIAAGCCILQFHKYYAKDLLLYSFGIAKVGRVKLLADWLISLCRERQSDTIFKGSIVHINAAPEPSDVLWTNCYVPYSILRLLGIYLITFLIIVLSFAIVGGMTYLQVYLQNNKQLAASYSSIVTVLNILISVVLQLINKIIWITLNVLLQQEYNHTLTKKVVSQMEKSIVLSCFNIIIMPIIVNYVFFNKLYGANGAAGIAFDYHVSALTTNLIMKLVGPLEMLLRIALAIKTFRNWLIKFKHRPTAKTNKHRLMYQDQRNKDSIAMKINPMYEWPYFDIAYAYSFILINILHASFYCQLQPFILILIFLECFFFYWICKCKIFYFCKIPYLTYIALFDTAAHVVILMPIMYGVGSIFVSYTTSLYTPIRTFSYIPPIICIVIGLVNFVNPGGVFNKIARLVDVKFNWVLKELNTEEESRDGEGDGDGGQRRLAETGENRELMKIKIEKNVIEEQSYQEDYASQESLYNLKKGRSYHSYSEKYYHEGSVKAKSKHNINPLRNNYETVKPKRTKTSTQQQLNLLQVLGGDNLKGSYSTGTLQKQLLHNRTVTTRFESYYKDSNLIQLLGFEKFLQQRSTEYVVEYVENYCKSHIKSCFADPNIDYVDNIMKLLAGTLSNIY